MSLYELTDKQQEAAVAAIQAMIAGYDQNGDAGGIPIYMFERALEALSKSVDQKKKSKRNARPA